MTEGVKFNELPVDPSASGTELVAVLSYDAGQNAPESKSLTLNVIKDWMYTKLAAGANLEKIVNNDGTITLNATGAGGTLVPSSFPSITDRLSQLDRIHLTQWQHNWVF